MKLYHHPSKLGPGNFYQGVYIDPTDVAIEEYIGEEWGVFGRCHDFLGFWGSCQVLSGMVGCLLETIITTHTPPTTTSTKKLNSP